MPMSSFPVKTSANKRKLGKRTGIDGRLTQVFMRLLNLHRDGNANNNKKLIKFVIQ